MLYRQQDRPENGKIDEASIIIIIVILILGAVLRFYDLGTESYWIDEMSTVVEGQHSASQVLHSGRLDQPPGYYLPFQVWVQWFGPGEVSTRSFSVLFGIGSLIVIYLIGKELFNKPVGLISSFLMALSIYQIEFSQQTRFYSYYEFMALLSCLFFILAIRHRKSYLFVFYSLASILMIYSHTFGVLILAVHALYFLLNWKKNKDIFIYWFFSQILVGLAFIPYFYPLFFGSGGLEAAAVKNIGGGTSRTVPLLTPLQTMYRFILPARDDRSWSTVLINYLIAGITLALGAGIYFWFKKYSLRTAIQKFLLEIRETITVNKSNLIFVLSWLLGPVLISFFLSIFVDPALYSDRYLIAASPAIYILAALLLYSFRKIAPVGISIIAVAVLMTPSLYYYYVNDTNEQWREVAAYVFEHSQSDDVVVFAPNLGIGIEEKTFSWYYSGNLDRYGLDHHLAGDTQGITTALDQFMSDYDRVWVIVHDDYPVGSTERFKQYFLDPIKSGMSLLDEEQFNDISVYLFDVKK